MLKDASGKVLGRAPRKALAVKNTCKKDAGKKDAGKKDAGKKDAGKKDAGTAKPQKKHAKAAALTTALMARSTSPTPPSSPSPTPPAPRSPRSPQRSPSHSPPHSPTYDREPWWDPVISLTRRMDAVAASLKDLQDRVKCLEDERVKLKAD